MLNSKHICADMFLNEKQCYENSDYQNLHDRVKNIRLSYNLS